MLRIVGDLFVLVLTLLLPVRVTRALLIRQAGSRFNPMGSAEPFWFIASCSIWNIAATEKRWYLIHHKRNALVCMVRKKSIKTNHAIWHCALVSLITLIFIEKSRRSGFEIGVTHPLRIIPLGISVTVVTL